MAKVFLLLSLSFCCFFNFTNAECIKKLQDKVAVITGGAQGIGKAIAETFAEHGAIVFIADIKDHLGSEVANSIQAKGQKAFFIPCDVSQEGEVIRLFSQISSSYGKVDILVNNAAIAIYKKMEEYSPVEWNQIISINLNSIFYTAKQALPLMKQRGVGNIISIASVHARTTATANTPYVASKGAIVSLTRALALEGAPYNIKVNCISPGAIHTPMLMENWGSLPPEQHPLLPRIPLKRLGTAKEVAQVALFLASEESSYITGTEILVDGGLSAHFD